MNILKNWLTFLATVNIIIVFIYWIVNIFFWGFGSFLNSFTTSWYIFLMFFSSLSAFRRNLEIATVLQIMGCFIQGIATFSQIGVGMAFNNITFWDYVLDFPLNFCTFFGFCIIAAGLLILEYIEVRRYNPKKHKFSFIKKSNFDPKI